MAITRAQLEAATEALRLVLRFDRPADSVLHEFFRAHHALGAGDRAFVADAVYGVLRRKRTVDCLAPDGMPRHMLLAYLTRIGGISVRELAALLGQGEQARLARVKAAPLGPLPLAARAERSPTEGSGLASAYVNAKPDPDADAVGRLPVAVRAELPDWIVERLAARYSEDEILALARGLNEPAPLDLRVNTLRADREEVRRALAADGIAAEATPYSPVGLRLKGRPPVNRHALFLRGAIEIQDEASQLLGFLLAPTRHDLVADFCAGAGGKSLMLGALMRSHGRLYAFDVSAQRLGRMKSRLKRSGLSNVHSRVIRNENDLAVKRLAGKMDRVLVDAPCSGLGTLRRNPDLKWRQSPQSVAELGVKQAAILRAAAGLVKPGGRLVYATCSLLAEENEQIAAAFLAEHAQFRQLDCAALLREACIPLDTGLFFRVFPHLHGTDAFFAAAMARA